MWNADFDRRNQNKRSTQKWISFTFKLKTIYPERDEPNLSSFSIQNEFKTGTFEL